MRFLLIFRPAIIEKFNNESRTFFGGTYGPPLSGHRFALEYQIEGLREYEDLQDGNVNLPHSRLAMEHTGIASPS